MRNHRTVMSESFISFQMLCFVIIQLAFLSFTVGWNWNGLDKELLHLHLWQTDHICIYISQHPVTPSKENDGLAMQSTIINTWKKKTNFVKSLFQYVISRIWNNKRLSDDVCSSPGKKNTIKWRARLSEQGLFPRQNRKIRISSQQWPHMHLYTSMCFPGFYLPSYQRHRRTSSFLLHKEPVFPPWTFSNIASRSHYCPYQHQKYQWAACSAGSSIESSVHLSYQHHVWDTFHHRCQHRCPLRPLDMLFGTVWVPEQMTPLMSLWADDTRLSITGHGQDPSASS